MRHQASHGAPELRCAHWIEAETGSSGSMRGAAGGWRATCTGEQADSRSAPTRHQTETGSSRSPRGAAGDWQLAAGGVGNTKDRDAPALEVRAGTPGVGRTAWDAAGLSSTIETELKWPEHQWRTIRDPSVLRQRLNFSRCCSDSQKRHSKLPGKAAREQKPGNTGSQGAHHHPPSQGTWRLYSSRVF